MSLAADARWRLRDGVRLDRVADLNDELRDRLALDGEREDGDREDSHREDGDREDGERKNADDAGVLSRRGGRAAPVLVDADVAALLERFGDGKSVAQAVLDLARDRDVDPHELLEASLPAVDRLVRKGYLVDADAPPVTLGYGVGDELGGWRIVRVLSRLEDSEVHLVRSERAGQDGEEATWGVLKISTAERSFGRPEHEVAILEHLAETDADVAPRLLGRGRPDDAESGAGAHAWIVLDFVHGTPIHIHARGLRRLEPDVARKGLLGLCVAAARAFAVLHRAGVAHGDVHPDNVLVLAPADGDATHPVRLVDLGCARRLDDGRERAPRPGVDLYREPEVAAAIRDQRSAPAASPAGEQYALAALCVELFTGRPYLEFSADRRELLRQIAEDPPRSFADLGAEPWPELESVLVRALGKDPAERYQSMDAFADALEEILDAAERAAAPEGASNGAWHQENAASNGAWHLGTLRETPAEDGVPSGLFFGSAGRAWGLLQAAVRRGDARTLALADLWAQRALLDQAELDQAELDQAELDQAELDQAERDRAAVPAADDAPSPSLPRLASAPLHGAAGVHETAACVAWARGDLRHFVRHARGFLDTSRDVFAETEADQDLDLDLALGRPGSLISAAHLLDRARPPRPDGSGEDRFGLDRLAGDLRTFGDGLLRELWRRLDARPELCRDDAYLGMAHGWAGALYASLVWCRAASVDPPAGVAERLDQLASEAVPFGRGLRWTRSRAGRSRAPAVGGDSMAGWCHGSAGYVLLFDTAARRPELSRFRAVADAAAWDVWDRFAAAGERPGAASHLCCGLAGQAWALAVHGHAESQAWFLRARALARAAMQHRSFDRPSEDRPQVFEGALFKGEGSLPALFADLEAPQEVPQEPAFPWLQDVGAWAER